MYIFNFYNFCMYYTFFFFVIIIHVEELYLTGKCTKRNLHISVKVSVYSRSFVTFNL